MAKVQLARTLRQQLSDAQRQMRDFVDDGDMTQDHADRILEHLRRAIKALRPDRA